MATKFILSGSNVYVFNLNEDTSFDSLPPKIYTVNHDKASGFHLIADGNKLTLPSKIYGTTKKRVSKCIQTYIDRNTSTGILLTGDKGTGKTLAMSLLANEVIEQLNIPVLLIKNPYAGSEFISFIELIGECCLVFDEFGKMYSARDKPSEHEVPQKQLLSLMDGVNKIKRMIIMTENSEHDIDEFMLNRPSRIYYHFKYRKLEEESIVGYCADRSVPKNITNDIIELSRTSKIFSFDMLQSIVEEQLRFNSTIREIVGDLNIDTSSGTIDSIEILKIINSENDKELKLPKKTKIANPNLNRYTLIEAINEEGEKEEIYLEPEHLVYEKEDRLVYEVDVYKIIARKLGIVKAEYSSLFKTL